MNAQNHTVNIRLPRANLLALLASADAITITPSDEQASAIAAEISQAAPAAAPTGQILNPADLPRRFLDASGNSVEAGSVAHVMTHFNTAGLIFDARSWQRVSSRKEAREVAAQCDLLGRKGDWVIGQDYETQLIVDRRFHAPAVDKKSFPHAPKEGLVYTDQDAAWSSVHVWFVSLHYGVVHWDYDGVEGFAVPVLRVPPSQ
jgi:hypothetical protein